MSSLYLFDIAALIILLIVIVFSSIALKWKNKLNTAFRGILFIVLCFTTIQIASNYLLSEDTININAAFAVKCLSALFFGYISTGFLIYAFVDISRTVKINRLHLIGVFLSLIWNSIWLVVNDFTHICFEVNSEGIVYNWGYFLLYFSFIVTMFYFPVMEVKFHKTLYGSSVNLSLTYSLLSLGFGLITLFCRIITDEVLYITSFFLACQITIAFMQMLIDRLSIDQNTDLYGIERCVKDLKHSNGSFIFLINIFGHSQYDSNIINQLFLNIKKYLQLELANFTLYRISPNQIILRSKSDANNTISTIGKLIKGGLRVNGENLAVRLRISFLFKEGIPAEEIIPVLDSVIERNPIDSRDAVFVSVDGTKSHIYNSLNVKRIISAIDNGDALPFYQGIYSVNDNKITLCEALARIKINDEILSPGSFLQVLETNHCVNKLDRSILMSVLKEIKKQKDLGENFDIQAISINLTADDLVNCEFIDYVKRMIIENEIDPQMICLELCETAVISNFEAVRSVMSDLTKLGIRFFLDDFGIGFSNLQAVLKLPFYLIKIDKSILDATKENNHNILLLDGFIKVLNSLGIKTLVEGVEDEIDLELVKKAGADFIQGYYFHKPSLMEDLNNSRK